jgi:Trk K+ transport system NAD-binding subunit
MQVYQLESRLFSLQLPEDSPLAGLTLAETRLGNMLGVKVVSIQRGSRRFEPEGAAKLEGGDLLIVDGEPERVNELLKIQRMEVQSLPARQLPGVPRGVGGVRATLVPGASIAGRSLRDLRFRERFGIAVAAIRHEGELIRDHLAERAVEEGDEILGLGTRESLKRFSASPEFKVEEVGLSAFGELQDQLCVILVAEDSELAGSTLGRSRLGELAGITVAGIIRDDSTRLVVSPTEIIQAGDRLLLTAEPRHLTALADLGEVRLTPEAKSVDLETGALGMVEAAIAPRSGAVGRTLQDRWPSGEGGRRSTPIWRGSRSALETPCCSMGPGRGSGCWPRNPTSSSCRRPPRRRGATARRRTPWPGWS